MTPEQWAQVEKLFQAAVDLAPAERAEYLAKACHNDPELRHEVESLLAYESAETIAEGAFQQAIRGVASAVVAEPSSIQGAGLKEAGDSLIGQMVGVYRILELIGRGGMGTVYLAERADAEFRQQVAIKIIKRGMDTDFIRDRFLQERQILASLEHPNIARLLDGGTTADGLPYFVMEHVTGTSLLTYCNAHRLSIAERLKLFRQVCAAVQHAHQKLVVHRDLKPSNILVNEEGVPKLLDFGIAKLLDPNATPGATQALTRTDQRLLTPDYASPEQVRGKAITTATDIYSLGVVLYELLTGQRPHKFDALSLGEIEHAICEQEPELPSRRSEVEGRKTEKGNKQTVLENRKTQGKKRFAFLPTSDFRLPTSALRGDLDNIILMALRKEPERRYQSVEQFSEDLRRHLEGLPVRARKDTFTYRTGKFVRRHRLSLAALALVFLTLLGSVIVTTRAARRAERRFAQVRKLSNTFLFEFDNKISKLAGAIEAREMVVKTALEYLDSLAQEASGDADLQLELAQAYLKVAKVQGDVRQGNLGQTDAAATSYRKAIAVAEAILPRDRGTKALECLSQAYLELGDMQVSNGDVPKGIATLKQGVPVAEQLYARGGTENSYLMPVIWAYEYLGDAQLESGDVPAAIASYQRALQIGEERAQKFPEDAAQNGLALEYERIGDALARQGDLDGTMEYYRRALPIREDLVKRRPDNAMVRRNLTTAYNWMGNHLGNPEMINRGEVAAALEYFRKAMKITEELAAADPKDMQMQHDLTLGYSRLGLMLANSDPAQAVRLQRQSLAISQAVLQAKPDDYRFLRRHLQALRRIAAPLQSLGDRDGALRHLQQALEAVQKLTAAGRATAEIQREAQRVHLALADLYLVMRNHPQANLHYEQVQALVEKESAAKDLSKLWSQAEANAGWARYYTALGEDKNTPSAARLAAWRSARIWRQKTLDVWQQWNQQAKPNPFGATQQELAARALAQCDAALGQLR
ncbi:MAG: protein kinase [Blastocatellia bacterium]|nr:protein kinase [Blastocatellia bacterium]